MSNITTEQEEQLNKLIDDTFEKVRLNSLRNGARMICGAVLGYASEDGTDKEKLDKIVGFCNDTLGRATVEGA